MVNQRSKSGCWTCRLRRKKCPEDGMPCSSCDARGVVCHGYGPRPAWKDRGDREREEVDRLQLRRRSHPRWPYHQHHQHHQHHHPRSHSEGDCQLPRPLPRPPLPPVPDMALQPSPPLSIQEEEHECESAITTTTNTTAEFSIDAVTLDLSSSDLASSLATPSAMLPDFWTHDMDGLLLATTPTLLDTSSSSTSIDTFDSSQLEMVGRDPPAKEHVHHAVRAFASTSSCSSSSQQAGTSHERETELMMQFLGDDFGQLFPSYPSSSVTEGAWLMCLLQRSSAFFYAALSTSAYLNLLRAPLHDAKRTELFREYDQLRGRAMESYCELLEAHCDGSHAHAESVFRETMICSVQLAVLESVSENIDAAQSHLCSALEALAKISHDSFGTSLLATPMQQQQQQHSFLTAASAMERKALAVFTSILIWMDVSYCSSRQTRPAAASLYRLTLSSTGPLNDTFSQVIGFEGWALLAFMDAIDTALWKRDEEYQSRLSMRELVIKSDAILSRIEHQMQQTKHTQTLIVAHALIIYIHTILSGCRPAVPEIQASLAQSVALWQKVSFSRRRGQLRPLSWAFCVSASLAANPHHRAVFMAVLSEARSVDSGSPTVACLQSVGEECWQILDAASADCDWEVVMRRQQRNLDSIFT